MNDIDAINDVLACVANDGVFLADPGPNTLERAREQLAELGSLRTRLTAAEAKVAHYEEAMTMRRAPYLHPDGTRTFQIETEKLGEGIARLTAAEARDAEARELIEAIQSRMFRDVSTKHLRWVIDDDSGGYSIAARLRAFLETAPR